MFLGNTVEGEVCFCAVEDDKCLCAVGDLNGRDCRECGDITMDLECGDEFWEDTFALPPTEKIV